MSTSPKFDDALREAIIQRPDVILDDHDLMHALIAANDRMMGSNIVDLRGIAMERLEHRLGRLEDTHRTVIAAAYENLAGMNQVHRAVLSLLGPDHLDAFLANLHDDVAKILRVDSVALMIEQDAPGADLPSPHHVMSIVEPGQVGSYITRGRASPAHQVTLRTVDGHAIFGDDAEPMKSEACLKLDLGERSLPGLLILGSTDDKMFSPQHGTDLMGFFAGVFERALRRLLP